MPDMEILKDTELMVAHVEAESPDAADFLDGYVLPKMAVLDSGRIIIPLDDLPVMLQAAAPLTAVVIDVTERRAS